MPARLRLEQNHAIEISLARLSERIGCGLMLKSLPKADFSDPLINTMANYGITTLHADKAAQKLADNSGLLKSFYESAFTHRTPLKQNFRSAYGHLEIYLAYDTSVHKILLEVLERYGAPPALCSIVGRLYSLLSVTIKAGKEEVIVP